METSARQASLTCNNHLCSTASSFSRSTCSSAWDGIRCRRDMLRANLYPPRVNNSGRESSGNILRKFRTFSRILWRRWCLRGWNKKSQNRPQNSPHSWPRGDDKTEFSAPYQRTNRRWLIYDCYLAVSGHPRIAIFSTLRQLDCLSLLSIIIKNKTTVKLFLSKDSFDDPRGRWCYKLTKPWLWATKTSSTAVATGLVTQLKVRR